MEYTKLGNTGMDVSRICLGCMGFGDAERWDSQMGDLTRKTAGRSSRKPSSWGSIFSIPPTSTPVERVRRSSDSGLKDFAESGRGRHRHQGARQNARRTEWRRAIAQGDPERDRQKLKRLGTDYVDLYQIHRWDYQTPIEETMEALHDVVRAGKARYIGASAMFAWQFQKALHVAEKYGWTRFVSMQDHLNLLYREEEREMLPLCREEKIGVIPYSPLASGRLTRDWSSERTHRSETDQIAKSKYDATAETDRQVIERVAEIAEKRGVPRVHIALAWLLQKKPVTAPIVGATKITHLEDAVGALSVKLIQEEVAYLEEPYVPHRIVGHQ